MDVLLDIGLSLIAAILFRQIFKLGHDLAMHNFMRDHMEAIYLWHVETYELKQEIKRLQAENDQLKLFNYRGKDA